MTMSKIGKMKAIHNCRPEMSRDVQQVHLVRVLRDDGDLRRGEGVAGVQDGERIAVGVADGGGTDSRRFAGAAPAGDDPVARPVLPRRLE